MAAMQDTLKSQQTKLVDLEDRSRRSNLVIFGITEQPKETESVLRDKVIKNIFETKLGLSCTSVARIHRLGKPSSKRPIILYFQDFNEKEAVLRNAKKLQGTGISIQNDYCADTLRKRKLLWESAREDKVMNKKVSLVHDKIRIDDKMYTWDDTSNSRKLIAKPKISPPST